jgi:hypothetical protein
VAPLFQRQHPTQYDGDYDPKEFLMKFEAAVESNGGDATTKAKALVLALKGEVQYWYANIPKGHITSWFQLQNKLLSSFKGMQVEELDSNDIVNMCVQGDRESLQEYMHKVVKLTARAPGVSESSTIDAIVGGLRVGNCQNVLDRIKPKSLQELFEVMQEYWKSDKGHRRRMDNANAAKKQKQQGQWDQPKGWQNHPPKQANCQINNVSAPLTRTRIGTAVGTRWIQKWQRAEAAAAKPAPAGWLREVLLLAPWDRRPASHPSMPLDNQEEVGMGS